MKVLQTLVSIILLTDKGGQNFAEMSTSARKSFVRLFVCVEIDFKYESIERFNQDQTVIFSKKGEV